MMLAQPCFTASQCALWQIVTSSAHVFFSDSLQIAWLHIDVFYL
ncbi:unnamed protein product [Staurois parvus]|uniref:Uncharacterized protein n=1 Tax=Staurois parvus TaxID=386267 RepID=A0ABN9BNV1_9NEOB|nr:unnamed protein product [Staurois parvus]